MDTTLEFPSSSSTPWCGGLCESNVASVIFPNSGELLSNSDELFRRRRSSLAEGEHTIAFVSSFPFPFCRSRARLDVIPIKSPSLFRCLFVDPMTGHPSARGRRLSGGPRRLPVLRCRPVRPLLSISTR
jgi:hypothetical protein